MCLSKVRCCPMTDRGALEGGNCCTKSRGLIWFYEVLRKIAVPAEVHLTCRTSSSRDLASRRKPRTMAELNDMCRVQTTRQCCAMFLILLSHELVFRVESPRFNRVGSSLGDCNTYRLRLRGAEFESCEGSISTNDRQRDGLVNVRLRGFAGALIS